MYHPLRWLSSGDVRGWGVPTHQVYWPVGVSVRGVYLRRGVPAQGVYLPIRCTDQRVFLSGGVYLTRGCTWPGGCTCPGVYLPRMCTCPGVYLPRMCTCPGTPIPPVNRMTDACEHINFPKIHLETVKRMRSSRMHTICCSSHLHGGVWPVGFSARGFLPRGCLPGGCLPRRGVCLGECLWTEWQTPVNTTLPQLCCGWQWWRIT